MTTRDRAPIGAPCWIDITTSDVERTRAFYCDLFGWTAEEPNPEFGGYFNFQHDGARTAGCMAAAPGMPDVWSVYLATDDAAKTVAAAGANGGTTIVEPMAVGDLGTMAVIVDAGGAPIGIWQPETFGGIAVLGEPGAPSWFELHTRAYDPSVAFYRNVFRWDTHVVSDAPEFRYTTLGEGEGQLAGIMDASGFLPDGVPAHWSVYFEVADVDATLARIGVLGGSTMMPAEDTPYGRLAVALDPTGAAFKLRGA